MIPAQLNDDQTQVARKALELYKQSLQSILCMERLPKKSIESYRNEMKVLLETQQFFNQNRSIDDGS